VSPTPIVSTGALPSHEEVQALLEEAYAACIAIDEGEVADYIPALAAAPRDAFGACIAGIGGGLYAVGDTTTPFSMQSVSKPFVFALVCQAIGSEEARETCWRAMAASTSTPTSPPTSTRCSARSWSTPGTWQSWPPPSPTEG
jgi:hypothetical protein